MSRLEASVHAIARASAACLWAAGDRVRWASDRLEDAGDTIADSGHGILNAAIEWSERRHELALRVEDLGADVAAQEARVNALVANLGGIVPYVARVADRLELVAQVADAPGPRLPSLEDERRRV